ncbi:hypothetical protein [Chitinophaga rhizophila]|uniref:Uncharacterized protein n=1 Tax=Chitinophaga rhizophila TaxID=2866212 RepID=A0ABS7GBA0_9BACT|nr:hypothetical protein [Chitinophaga rhizophila]MBW8684948.1 hypothetical protein [Chitinophaga rhizophila]
MKQSPPLKISDTQAAMTAAASIDTVRASDWSGTVHTIVVAARSSYGQTHNIQATVPPDYVLVGGGATILPQFTKPGAFLTGNYPDSNLLTWHSSSIAHLEPFNHQLVSYAIGIKIFGLSRKQLLQHIKVTSVTSGYSSNPAVSFIIDTAGYKLIGGGAKLSSANNKLLLTSSYPYVYTWNAAGGEYESSSPGYITGTAISISRKLLGLKNLETSQDFGYSFVYSEGFHTGALGTDTTWVVTGPGVLGEFLTAVIPTPQALYGTSNSLSYSSNYPIALYMLKIRKKLPQK